MKKIVLFVTLLILITSFFQANIETVIVNATARLDLTSTSQTLLLHRIIAIQTNAISPPTQWIVMYQPNFGSNGELEVFDRKFCTNTFGSAAIFACQVIYSGINTNIHSFNRTT